MNEESKDVKWYPFHRVTRLWDGTTIAVTPEGGIEAFGLELTPDDARNIARELELAALIARSHQELTPW
jgi:hypothetical protein